MLLREEEEAEIQKKTELILIYPLINYAQDYYIEENFPIQEKNLRKEIEEKR